MGTRQARPSPFTSLMVGAAPTGGHRPLRVAFLGRTSTEDQQDPTISIPRQLRTCQAVLPEEAVIVAQFYDVESGRNEPRSRGSGRGLDGLDIPVRRDGGITDLLDRAGRPDRGFDAVICESVDRIARRTFYGVLVEHTLERVGITLMAADEPGSIVAGGSRATGVLTRRIKQGVAEWYVLDMLEKSWAGFQEHTFQGFNVGKAPYGYLAERVPHPVPARRAEGKAKTKLRLDPVRAPVVAQMFAWRVVERMSYRGIADRLNLDPERYPPPEPPDPSRAGGSWIPGAVRSVLANPKYTGYMVWNRRARSRGNIHLPADEWVCSSTPTHPGIVTVETFQQAAQVASRRRASRTTPGPNRAHPFNVGRSYLLRGFVFCAICGYRMCGHTVRGYTYFRCQPRDQAERGHSGSIFVQQATLLAGVQTFLDTRLFGQQRRVHIAESIDDTTLREEDQRARALEQVRCQIADIERRRGRLVKVLEDSDDSDSDFITTIRLRLAELRSEQHTAEAARQDLLQQVHARPQPALLDRLPIGRVNLTAPEPVLRTMLEVARLEIHYDRTLETATYTCTLTAEAIDELARPRLRTYRAPCGVHRPSKRADRRNTRHRSSNTARHRTNPP